MSGDNPSAKPKLRLPKTGVEFWALVLSVAAVFVLVQLGAPLIRTLDFLDPKIRDYFIGMSFAAFPFIHSACKGGLERYRRAGEPVLHDSGAWYVTGIVAGALLFAWNQFVGGLVALSLLAIVDGLPQLGGPAVDPEALMVTFLASSLIVVLPLSGVAAVFAGMQLNRHTRSRVLAALAAAAVFFVASNVVVSWAMNAAFVEEVVAHILAGGPEAVETLFGFSLFGLVVFFFGCLGVFVSRLRGERPLGRLLEAARRLPAEQREALAAEVMRRANAEVVEPPAAAP